MKKTLFGGMMILTLLGIGRLVYANSNGSLNHLKSTSPRDSNKLTAQKWDDLVAEVENLKASLSSRNNAPATPQASIPDGAIMAFDLNQCPEGWSIYTEAKGRFIMGAEYNGDLKTHGGSGNIKLTVGQLPPHSHDISVGGRGTENGDGGWNVAVVGGADFHPNAIRSWKTGKTASVGNGESINILNPYVKLLYCIKGGEGSKSLGSKPINPQPIVPPTPAPQCGIGVYTCSSGTPIEFSRQGQLPQHTCTYTRKCQSGNQKISCKKRDACD